jgi:hypothetical protein
MGEAGASGYAGFGGEGMFGGVSKYSPANWGETVPITGTEAAQAGNTLNVSVAPTAGANYGTIDPSLLSYDAPYAGYAPSASGAETGGQAALTGAETTSGAYSGMGFGPSGMASTAASYLAPAVGGYYGGKYGEDILHHMGVGGRQEQQALGGIGGGAMAGAAIGSMFGGVGAVPGAIIGGIVGGVTGTHLLPRTGRELERFGHKVSSGAKSAERSVRKKIKHIF